MWFSAHKKANHVFFFFLSKTLTHLFFQTHNKLHPLPWNSTKITVQMIPSDVSKIRDDRMSKWEMVRKKGSVLSLKIRSLISNSASFNFSSARVLIMTSFFKVASFLISCCSISVCILLMNSQVILKNFSIFTTWNRVLLQYKEHQLLKVDFDFDFEFDLRSWFSDRLWLFCVDIVLTRYSFARDFTLLFFEAILRCF